MQNEVAVFLQNDLKSHDAGSGEYGRWATAQYCV
jgi:hypothetical protein